MALFTYCSFNLETPVDHLCIVQSSIQLDTPYLSAAWGWADFTFWGCSVWNYAPNADASPLSYVCMDMHIQAVVNSKAFCPLSFCFPLCQDLAVIVWCRRLLSISHSGVVLELWRWKEKGQSWPMAHYYCHRSENVIFMKSYKALRFFSLLPYIGFAFLPCLFLWRFPHFGVRQGCKVLFLFLLGPSS